MICWEDGRLSVILTKGEFYQMKKGMAKVNLKQSKVKSLSFVGNQTIASCALVRELARLLTL